MVEVMKELIPSIIFAVGIGIVAFLLNSANNRLESIDNRLIKVAEKLDHLPDKLENVLHRHFTENSNKQ